MKSSRNIANRTYQENYTKLKVEINISVLTAVKPHYLKATSSEEFLLATAHVGSMKEENEGS